jgi:hypothetical protein
VQPRLFTDHARDKRLFRPCALGYGCEIPDPAVQAPVTVKPLIQTKSVPYSTRRLTEKGSSTVIRILEEAKNIIVEAGFLGLSFRAIAKRTGTTVGNIGYYYGTKDRPP